LLFHQIFPSLEETTAQKLLSRGKSLLQYLASVEPLFKAFFPVWIPYASQFSIVYYNWESCASRTWLAYYNCESYASRVCLAYHNWDPL